MGRSLRMKPKPHGTAESETGHESENTKQLLPKLNMAHAVSLPPTYRGNRDKLDSQWSSQDLPNALTGAPARALTLQIYPGLLRGGVSDTRASLPWKLVSDSDLWRRRTFPDPPGYAEVFNTSVLLHCRPLVSLVCAMN
ncbi:unnamed protein product [Pleuronectes platessa]|uniref:Uncharacterized protein n=1 Tax=Pleuronectes platessa TaxID=8262 RepID=A0A9N7YBH8_PLEPL|nr:unnamed protein product [Pleuronectes platessa]